MKKQIMNQKKLQILLLTIIGIFAFLLFVFAYFTLLDFEWQDWQILNQVKKNHELLRSYKATHSQYPDSLAKAGAKNRYCNVFRCFEIKYKPSNDRQTYTSAARANSPFVAYLRSEYEYGIGFEENYNGDRTDLPIYRKDNQYFPDPTVWPKL